MRKILSLAVLALAGLAGAQAAEPAYEYVPFVREGVQWHCKAGFSYTYWRDYYYEFEGDSVVNGKTYKKCYRHFLPDSSHPSQNNVQFFALFREADKVVYLYQDNFEDGIIWTTFMQHIEADNEVVVYDFNDIPGCYNFGSNGRFGPFATDQPVEINDKMRKRYKSINGYIVEGIGFDSERYGDPLMLFFPGLTGPGHYEYPADYGLDYVTENGDTVYYGRANINYVPLAREGVQWFYNMDELDGLGNVVTKAYTYEFSGDTTVNGMLYKKCFRYSGESMSAATDVELVALVRDYCMEVDCIENKPLAADASLLMWHYEDGTTPGTIDDEDWLYLFYPDFDVTSPYKFDKAVTMTTDTLLFANSKRVVRTYTDETGSELGKTIEGIGYDGLFGDMLRPFRNAPVVDGKSLNISLNRVVDHGHVYYGKGHESDGIDDVTADSRRTGDGRYYDLTGRAVADPAAPGIYIHNGKKVLVR